MLVSNISVRTIHISHVPGILSSMTDTHGIVVYGAYGHTGRFIVSELRRRGRTPILSGRDGARLNTVDATSRSEVRAASVDDPASLDRALSDAAAVINCAGPFLDTAAPLIDAAIRQGIPYLDVAAEQAAVLDAFERFAKTARDASIAVIPAMAFFGGLADLLATVAMGDWTAADEILIAIALDSWKPTQGTRLTGRRNAGARFYYSNNRLERADPPPPRTWEFPMPFGMQEVVGLSFAETITIPQHLQVQEIRTYMNLAPLADLRDPNTPEPTAVDDSGRSSQIFLVDVVARKNDEERRMTARGRDIYAITAPIVAEAVERVLDGRVSATGVIAAGRAFDAREFLTALSQSHLSLEIR